MKKLIELDATLDALREVIVPAEDIGFGDESTDGYNDGINMAVTVVSGLPTVDAVPVVHGRWQWVSSTYDRTPCEMRYWCSKCHHETITHGSEPWEKFCPNCGALMDGKDGDHAEGAL